MGWFALLGFSGRGEGSEILDTIPPISWGLSSYSGKVVTSPILPP